MRIFVRTLAAVAAIGTALIGAAPLPPSIPSSTYPISPTSRDGRNDFNFEFGTWRTHYRILKKRLAGDHEWYDCYGTSIIRPFWDGSGNLEDGDLRCPTRYVGGLTLRTYDARTHQWTLWWGTRALSVAPPQQVGHFSPNGTGDFYSYDSWQGKPEITRFQWTTVRGNPHFEQAYSTDAGKSWETNWTTDYVRVPASAKGVWNASGDPRDGHAGFDFLIGRWKTHYTWRRHALAHDDEWRSCEGTSVVRAFWAGSGDLEDAGVHCPARNSRNLAMRLYDPKLHRWTLYNASQQGGLRQGAPEVGAFAGGVGTFYARATEGGRPAIVRYRWDVKNGLPHFEEAYSADDGKSWETESTVDYVSRL